MSSLGTLAQDLANAGTPPGPQWGIFDQDLNPVIVGDSCVVVDFRKEYRISDYPVEQGGFASYNKVATPYDFKMTFTQGGSSSDRQSFLDAVDAVVASLSLYNAVTPDATYQNANAVNYSYRRTATDGVTLLTVEIFLEEVRQTAQAAFSSPTAGSAPNVPALQNTVSPTSVSQVNDGVVQPTLPTPAQQAIVLPQSSLVQAFRGSSEMLIIPLASVPSQTLTTTLNGQSCEIDLRQTAYGLFCDLYVSGVLIIGGVLCENLNRIVRSVYLGFLGDLLFFDTQGTSNPTFFGLGSRYQLAYLSPSDLLPGQG